MSDDGDARTPPRELVSVVAVAVAAVAGAADGAPLRDDAALDAEARAALRPEPHNPSYARTGRARILRWLLIIPWLGFATYSAYAAQQILPPIINGQPLGGNDIADDLLLGRLVPVLRHAPLLAFVPPLFLLVVLVLASRAALRDARRERAFLADRKEWESEYHRRLGTLHDEENARQIAFAHQRIDETERRDIGGAPAPVGPSFDLTALPAPPVFVGRDGDLAWLLKRLREGGTTGITALGGLGGIGKTALAAVATRLLYKDGHFKDGIVAVSCLGQTDPASVLLAVLTVIGGKLPDDAGAADQHALARALYHRLHGKDMLIVLDNVEPDLGPLTAVTVPLREAGATLLVTARQTLSAGVVAADDMLKLDVLSPADALLLFATTYLGADKTAEDLSTSGRDAAERIVHSLALHTLAVRLAAAYAREAGRDLPELARELAADPLKVPGEDASRAVELVFRQSTDRLPAEARRLFAALACFATNEFGRRAALAAAAGLDAPDPEVTLDLLARRALLDAQVAAELPEDSDRERLRLHPLLRELAASLLDEPTHAAAALAIATFYARYANATPDAAKVPDADNIAGALEWTRARAPDSDRDALIAAICDGMQYFWRDTSRTADSLLYLPWALEAAGRIAESGTVSARLNLGYLLLSYADLLFATGDTAEAQEHYGQAYLVFGEVKPPDVKDQGRALRGLGDTSQRRGDALRAQKYYEQSLALLRPVDLKESGISLRALGDIQVRRGMIQEGEESYQESLILLQQAGDRLGEGVTLRALGDIMRAYGNFGGAREKYRGSLRIAREVGDLRAQAFALRALGEMASPSQGMQERSDARTYFDLSLELWEAIQDREEQGVTLRHIGDLEFLQGKQHEAINLYHRSLEMLKYSDDRVGMGYTLCRLGELEQERGNLQRAEEYYHQSVDLLRESGHREGEGMALCRLGLLKAQQENPNEAEAYFRMSLNAAQEAQVAMGTAEALGALGAMLIRWRRDTERDEACARLREAISLYRRMDQIAKATDLMQLAADAGCG